MPDPDTVRQPLLELGDLRAEDELPVVEDPLDAGVDRVAQLAVLGLEVDEVAFFRCAGARVPLEWLALAWLGQQRIDEYDLGLPGGLIATAPGARPRPNTSPGKHAND